MKKPTRNPDVIKASVYAIVVNAIQIAALIMFVLYLLFQYHQADWTASLGYLQAGSEGPVSITTPVSLLLLLGVDARTVVQEPAVSFSRRDGHPHLWTELWVSHYQ